MTQPSETRAEAFARLEREGRVAFESLELPAGVALSADGDLEVEVIRTGEYKARGFKMTAPMLDEMVKNHQAAGVDPALDREHESWFGTTGAPALGWVKSLSVKPSTRDARNKALFAKVELTNVGAEALAQKHFRYVSAGVLFNAKDRESNASIGTFLDHVALVKHPFVQGMRPVANSAGSADQKEPTMTKVALKLGLPADADEDKLVEALSTRLDAAEKAKTDAEALVASAQGETAALSKRIGELEDVALAAEVEKAVGEFRITPAEKSEYLSLGKVNRAQMSRLIALREPKNPSSALSVKATSAEAGAGRQAAQDKALSAYKAENPAVDDAHAFMAVVNANPTLFADEEV